MAPLWFRQLRLRPLLEVSLGLLLALALMTMMLLTAIDVVARYLFDAPLDGAFELTELLLAVVIFAALPLTTERRGHVEVDLLELLSRGLANKLARAFAMLVSAVTLGIIAWQLFAQGLRHLQDGSVTNTLELPYYPLGFFGAGAAALSAVIAVRLAARDLTGHGRLSE